MNARFAEEYAVIGRPRKGEEPRIDEGSPVFTNAVDFEFSYQWG